MINAHYAKVINLPAATYKAASLASFYDTTEKHLRSLCSLGEDNNQMQILSMMQSKLPRGVLVDLEKMKSEDEERTVINFQKFLNRHINALKAGDIQMFK